MSGNEIHDLKTLAQLTLALQNAVKIHAERWPKGAALMDYGVWVARCDRYLRELEVHINGATTRGEEFCPICYIFHPDPWPTCKLKRSGVGS
jgi:hypothetical protein